MLLLLKIAAVTVETMYKMHVVYCFYHTEVVSSVFGNKSKSGGLIPSDFDGISPSDFDSFRRNHSVGTASEALRRCLMR
jgi:hypothetical protein